MTTPTRKKRTLEQRAERWSRDRGQINGWRPAASHMEVDAWLAGYRAAQRDIKRSEVK